MSQTIHYSTDDILKKIPDAQLTDLRDLFKLNWPYSVQAYQFIDNYISWKKFNKDVRVLFTCPEGIWQDGTFVAIVGEFAYNIFFYTLQPSCKRLCRALQQTKLINWKRGPYICCIHADQVQKVLPVLRNIGHPIEFEIDSTCYWLPKEEALKFDLTLPHGIYIASLKKSQAKEINSVWTHAYKGSEQYVANLIEMNGGVGLYQKTNGELCCWAMVNDLKALAVLQTMDKHKRKGYASVVVKEISRRLAMGNSDVVLYIVRKNMASRSLFESLGFKLIHGVTWVQYKNVCDNHVNKL